MEQYFFRKRYENHYGLDYKRNALTRPVEFASDMLNAQYRKSGSIEKRKGFQSHGATGGGFGLATYQRKNPTTGADEAELISIARSGLKKFSKATFTVAYAGVGTTASISIYFDTATEQYRCGISESGTAILDMALGFGYDTASPVTLLQLQTAINALTGFTATITGTTSTPAAFLKIVRNHELVDADMVTSARYPTDVNTTVTNPFNTYYGTRNDDDFELMSFVNLDNLLVLSGGGKDYVHKYDGQTLYRVGLPTPATLTAAEGVAGAITGTNYQYRARYVQWDAAGNLIEGNILTMTSSLLNPTTKKIDITVANIQAGTGFNTNCAQINGAQVSVNTITVDSGHTIKVGDTAYFWDSVSSSYVERTVTAIAATTITVSGAAVTVVDNDAISNNLRIQIVRSKTGATTPTVHYVVAEIPNNSLTATTVYVDNTLDAALGDRLIRPVSDRTVPPLLKYLFVFQGQLCGLGNPELPNQAYWSDVDGLEYFPADNNQQSIDNDYGEILTGGAKSGEVAAWFTDKTTTIMSGYLADNSVRFDEISSDIGCKAHQTIKKVGNYVAFWSNKGPYKILGANLPQPLGESADSQGRSLGGRMEPVLDQAGVVPDEVLEFKRAVSVNDRDAELYITFIPAETSHSGEVASNENSKLFVYDYARDAWLLWDTIDMSGGAAIFDGDLLWQERHWSTFDSAIRYLLYRKHNLNDAWDYEDEDAAISQSYKSGWEAAGEPSVFKKYMKLRCFQLEETPNSNPTITLKQEVDFNAEVTQAQTSFTVFGLGYGVSGYGTEPYGDAGFYSSERELADGHFVSSRFVFENEEHQTNSIISGWEVEMVAPYEPRFKP